MSLSDMLSKFMDQSPRPGLHPIPGSKSLTLEAMLCPPMIYYLALLFLPPAPPPAMDTRLIKLLRNALALLAGFLFFRLPLAYHVPQSIGLTYQLGLVGLYGGARVLDAFFVSPYIYHHVPRRVHYRHEPRVATPFIDNAPNAASPKPNEARKLSSANSTAIAPRAQPGDAINAASSRVSAPSNRQPSAASAMDNLRRGSLPYLDESYFLLHKTMTGPEQTAVTEHATTEDGWPHGFLDRAAWALELELSMRGVGFTWTTADVRHSKKTWLPTVSNRLHSLFMHVVPILGTCFLIIRTVYLRYLHGEESRAWDAPAGQQEKVFDNMPLPIQLLLTAALGAFLMAAFSFAHSAFAIVCAPLAPSPLAFFPPLYTTRIWNVQSVRGFWSYGWHRLFARFFLVYGVRPGEWLERTLTGKRGDERADVGKVLGGFLSSAFCHSFAVRGVLGGEWPRATGEAKFFAVNGVAVVLEEGLRRWVRGQRKRRGLPLEMWYDAWIGRVWWIGVLLFSGRNFARGWVDAGLVREMSAM